MVNNFLNAEPENVVEIDIENFNNPVQTEDGTCHFINTQQIQVVVTSNDKL